MCLVLQITFTTRAINGGKENASFLPVSYPKFPTMCVKGDTIFLGKYLVTGSEDSSLYLTVRSAAIDNFVAHVHPQEVVDLPCHSYAASRVEGVRKDCSLGTLKRLRRWPQIAMAKYG